MSKMMKLAGFSLAFWLLLGTGLLAQSVGTIHGVIKDSSGAAIPGARLTATNQATGINRTAGTDAAGRYVIPQLPVGTYTVTASANGMGTVKSTGIVLQVEQNREVDLALQPAAQQTTVEVTAAASQVQVERASSSLGQVINSQQVAQLPLNGRNFVQLALLSPGAVRAENPGNFLNQGGSSEVSFRGSVSLSVQGMRENANDWLLDGMDNNELTAGAISILPSIDDIEEFKVLTYNYSAQYGSRGGDTVLVTTKAGGNAMHGSAFEYLRNDALDARNFFDGAKKGKYIQNEFGFSLGGPIQKDKTFYFLSWQTNKIRQGLTLLSTVPTQDERNGIFDEAWDAPIYDPGSTSIASGVGTRTQFTSNTIPGNQISSIGQALVDLFPLPNLPGHTGNYLSNPVKTIDDSQYSIRLDHAMGQSDHVFTRFSRDNAHEFIPSGLPGFGAQGSFYSTQNIQTHARNVVVSETHIFSPTLVNQFTTGYNRDYNYIHSYGYGTNESQKLGIPGANLGDDATSEMTQMSFTGYQALGDRGYSPYQGGTNVWQDSDNLAWVHGNHTVDMGFIFRAMQENTLGDSFLQGQFVFSPLFTAGFKPNSASLNAATGNAIASALLGLPYSGDRNNELAGYYLGRRWKEYRGYLQDNWHASSSLTLQLGFAYGLTTPQYEAHDRWTNYDLATGKFLIADQNGVSRYAGVAVDRGNYEPRIGFAYSPWGANGFVFRGGYGIFYDTSSNGGTTGMYQNPPYASAYAFQSDGITPVRTIIPGSPILGFPDNSQPPNLATYGGALHIVQPNFRQGQIQQWNYNVEKQLPANVVFTVAYAGTHGTHIADKTVNVNVPSPGSLSTLQSRRPYPQLQTISDMLSMGLLNYQSLQVKAEKQTSHGLYLLAGYTWSKALTNALSQEITGDPGVHYFPLSNGPNSDKGLAGTNLTNNFTLSFLYQLPVGRGKALAGNLNGVADLFLGGWEVNGIALVHSGFPIGMSVANDLSGTGLGNRPDRTCDGKAADPTVGAWFNTSCFANPAPATLGNSSRTVLYGPGQANLDFSLQKNIPVGEGSMQFRGEFFNLLNHAQFAIPGTTLGAGTFGRITSTTNTSRQIQFALRYQF